MTPHLARNYKKLQSTAASLFNLFGSSSACYNRLGVANQAPRRLNYKIINEYGIGQLIHKLAGVSRLLCLFYLNHMQEPLTYSIAFKRTTP